MKPNVAIIGRGNVGSALADALDRAGYEREMVGNEPGRVREAAAWGDAILLAVPFSAVDDAAREIADGVEGKPLIDVTNALTPDYRLALGCTTSGAEELQKKLPGARVVKAFNAVFADNMRTGNVLGERLTAFVAGDDAPAKEITLQMARDIGFDGVDAGPLENARWLETLAFLNIQLGFAQEMGTDIGFKLVRPRAEGPVRTQGEREPEAARPSR